MKKSSENILKIVLGVPNLAPTTKIPTMLRFIEILEKENKN